MVKQFSSSSILILFAGFIAVGLIVLAVMNGNSPKGADTFAQCLTEKGAKMYGAWWCPHCLSQKKLFGGAFKKIQYIECSPNGTKEMSQECIDDGIEGYPTWEFADGSRLSGEQTFEKLSEKTGCEIIQEE